jgi:hypothetical protein
MIGRTLIAAALIGAAPAYALGPAAPGETQVRNMVDYLEAVPDPQRGVYIRGYTGQWYYARVHGACPRLTRNASLRFNPSPSGDFDRNSSIRADGWRCLISSVVESDGPPRASRRSRH